MRWLMKDVSAGGGSRHHAIWPAIQASQPRTSTTRSAAAQPSIRPTERPAVRFMPMAADRALPVARAASLRPEPFAVREAPGARDHQDVSVAPDLERQRSVGRAHL